MLPAQVLVIHLERRTDRLANFRTRWAATGLDVAPVIFAATDQTRHDPPDPRWDSYPHGTWGCWDSHVRALRAAVGPVLIVEDDAVFAPCFGVALAQLTLPPDWELVHLGGQHLTRPDPVAPGLVRPVRMLRTHAYLARYPQILAGALRGHKTHVDYALGQLPVHRYACAPWLVGQDDTPGDITRRQPNGFEWWQEARCGA